MSSSRQCNYFIKKGIVGILSVCLLFISGYVAANGKDRPHTEFPRCNPNPGLVFVDYRDLKGGKDGVVLMDLDPESNRFGRILQRKPIGKGVLPHHLYFNRDEDRLYTTSLGGANLYEIELNVNRRGIPRMKRIIPIDTGGNTVGEDIYFTEDGSRYYVTFMGGVIENGAIAEAGGSVGVFDAHTNELLKTIRAPIIGGLDAVDDPNSLNTPYILYPHGISANEELGLMFVTSTIHADLTTGVGDTVTLLDMNNDDALIKTYQVSDELGSGSSPVEVLALRDDLPPFALVNTMLGGDVWVSQYNPATQIYDEFVKKIEGDDLGHSWALEFYIQENNAGEKELYISFAVPGVINVYSLDELPELPLKRTLDSAGLGAHHMSFYETRSGREVVVVQNNLLNIPGLNSGVLTVVDTQTGEVLGTVNLPERYGIMPESVESAFGSGHDLHH